MVARADEGRAAMTALGRACLLLCLLNGTQGVAQDDDSQLQAWQRRLLDAIEESATQAPESTPESYRGPLNDEGAADAARKAREQHGGRVLAVGRVGEAYRVRLLLDDGRVITVEVVN